MQSIPTIKRWHSIIYHSCLSYFHVFIKQLTVDIQSETEGSWCLYVALMFPYVVIVTFDNHVFQTERSWCHGCIPPAHPTVGRSGVPRIRWWASAGTGNRHATSHQWPGIVHYQTEIIDFMYPCYSWIDTHIWDRWFLVSRVRQHFRWSAVLVSLGSADGPALTTRIAR